MVRTWRATGIACVKYYTLPVKSKDSRAFHDSRCARIPRMRMLLSVAALVLPAAALGRRAAVLPAASVKRPPSGRPPAGTAVDVFTLTNSRGVEVRAMTYGATIISVRTPDRTGRIDDVVLGFERIDDYLTKAR